MRRIGHGLAAVVILASGAGDTSCEAAEGGGGSPFTSPECVTDTRGIAVSNSGTIQDIVTARCGPTLPQEHTLEAWLEYRDGGEYRQVGSHRSRTEIPDAAGVSLRVSTACESGRYRTGWRAYGVSSNGTPFDLTDHDFFSTPIDC